MVVSTVAKKGSRGEAHMDGRKGRTKLEQQHVGEEFRRRGGPRGQAR